MPLEAHRPPESPVPVRVWLQLRMIFPVAWIPAISLPQVQFPSRQSNFDTGKPVHLKVSLSLRNARQTRKRAISWAKVCLVSQWAKRKARTAKPRRLTRIGRAVLQIRTLPTIRSTPESPGATTRKLTLESLSSMTILVFRIPFVSLFLRSRPTTTTLCKQK